MQNRSSYKYTNSGLTSTVDYNQQLNDLHMVALDSIMKDGVSKYVSLL